MLCVVPAERVCRPLDQLRIDSLSLRKKTTYCLGSLSMLLSNKQLQGLISNIIKCIQGAKKHVDAYTYVQSLSSISRNIGYKLGAYLDQIIPLIQK